MKPECKDIIFKAFDGKEFNSYDECCTYNQQPRVYILNETLYDTPQVIKVFANKQVAEKCINDLRDKHHRILSPTYTLTIMVLNMDTQPTVQEQITNAQKLSNLEKIKKAYNYLVKG